GLSDRVLLVQTIDVQAIIVRGIHQDTVTSICLFGDVAAGHDLSNWQLTLGCKLVVTGIVRWHSHNRTGTVAHHDVVTDEDWDLLAVDRVGGISTAEYTGLFLVFLTLQLRLGRDVLQVSVDSILWIALAVGPLGVDIRTVILGACQFLHQLVLRSQHHVLSAKQSVRTGGKYADVVAFGIESSFCTAGAANPVALHGLDLLRPIKQLQVIQQAIGVRSNAHHPLAQVLAEDWEIAALRTALSSHFLICQNRAQTWAPVHGGVGQVNQTEFIDSLSLLSLGQVVVNSTVLGSAGACF